MVYAGPAPFVLVPPSWRPVVSGCLQTDCLVGLQGEMALMEWASAVFSVDLLIPWIFSSPSASTSFTRFEPLGPPDDRIAERGEHSQGGLLLLSVQAPQLFSDGLDVSLPITAS